MKQRKAIAKLIRWGVTVGIAGTTLLTVGIIENLRASALSEEEIFEKLDPIPVFTIADEKGASLVAKGKDESKVAGVFISQEDANQFVDKLKIENPELASKVKVVPVSLGEVYQLAESAKNQESPLNFAYVPIKKEENSAKSIGTYEEGVPLFFAVDAESDEYITVEQNSREIIPFFFTKQQTEEAIKDWKGENSELDANIVIDTISLEEVIKDFENSDDEILDDFALVASTEAKSFLATFETKEEPAIVSQNTQKLSGHWRGEDTGLEVDLLLYSNGGFGYIVTSTQNLSWFSNVGNWTYSNGVLSLKNDDGTIFNEAPISLNSNSEFIFEDRLYSRENIQPNPLRQQLAGTWKVNSKATINGTTKILYEFQSDGRYRSQRTDLYPSLSVVDPGEVTTGDWKWMPLPGDYLDINGGFCRVYWSSNDEFVCVDPSKSDSVGSKLRFQRTNDQI